MELGRQFTIGFTPNIIISKVSVFLIGYFFLLSTDESRIANLSTLTRPIVETNTVDKKTPLEEKQLYALDSMLGKKRPEIFSLKIESALKGSYMVLRCISS